jgi:predicted PurR-regulated permease PerM
MTDWILDHWFVLTVSWALVYSFTLDHYYKNMRERGPMRPLVAVLMAIICVFWPILLGGILIANLIRSGSESDET